MKKKRYSTDPRLTLASEQNRRFISVERGGRKRKALSEIFPTSQNEGTGRGERESTPVIAVNLKKNLFSQDILGIEGHVLIKEVS